MEIKPIKPTRNTYYMKINIDLLYILNIPMQIQNQFYENVINKQINQYKRKKPNNIEKKILKSKIKHRKFY